MDIRKYAVRKRPREVEADSDDDCQNKHTSKDPHDQPPTASTSSAASNVLHIIH